MNDLLFKWVIVWMNEWVSGYMNYKSINQSLNQTSRQPPNLPHKARTIFPAWRKASRSQTRLPLDGVGTSCPGWHRSKSSWCPTSWEIGFRVPWPIRLVLRRRLCDRRTCPPRVGHFRRIGLDGGRQWRQAVGHGLLDGLTRSRQSLDQFAHDRLHSTVVCILRDDWLFFCFFLKVRMI